MATTASPKLADVRAAREHVRRVARVTPLVSSETLSRRVGRPVFLKAENLQRTGSFKIRGAVAKLASLSDAERAAGVVAASAGNHGQAVAWAAREAGVRATVFMPADAPMAKVDATRNYGADVVLAGEGYDGAYAAALERTRAGAPLVHAFEDERVIAGQGTIALELVEQLSDLDTLVVPVGGGGLAAGTALALAELRPGVRIVGVQAAAYAGLGGEVGGGHHAFTIADGIAVKRPGELTRAILADRLADVVTVTDEEIAEAIVLLLERTKLLVEGAGAAAVAALLAGRAAPRGPVCALLSGGNIDATVLVEVVRYGLSRGGRFLMLRTRLPDRPGALVGLLDRIAAEHVNVLSIDHHREAPDLPVAETAVELTLATRDEAHCAELLALIGGWGYDVERIG